MQRQKCGWFGIIGLGLSIYGLLVSIVLAQSMDKEARLVEAKRLHDEAVILYQAGKFSEAEPLWQRVLQIREQVWGTMHPEVAASLNNLALLYYNQGRAAKAEPLYRRALQIQEQTLGPMHLHVATSLHNLGLLHESQGRYNEAEPLLQRALHIREQALGSVHPVVANSLNNLASLYRDQGRYSEAEPLQQRALAIWEQVLGPEHPSVAIGLNNLAELYHHQGCYAEAEPLYQHALALSEQGLGLAHPLVATSLSNLAELYQDQGRYAEAEPLLQRALAISEQTLGAEHPQVAYGLHNLAEFYRAQGRYAEATPYSQRALVIFEQTWGPMHPEVALRLGSLALLYDAQHQMEKALDFSRKATTIYRRRALRTGTERSTGGLSEQKMVRPAFVDHMDLLTRFMQQQSTHHIALLTEAFEVNQLAQATSTAETITRMAARFSTGTDALARTIRAHQDTLSRWQSLQAQLVEAMSSPPDQRDVLTMDKLHQDLATLDDQLTALENTLTRDFPAYAELTTPQPLSLTTTQHLLGADEALLTYLVEPDQTYLWVVRSDRATLHRLDLGQEALDQTVTQLRRTLTAKGGVRPFDVDQAYTLYRQIFAPAEPLLDGVRHIMLVADAGLQSLPFSALVTAEPPQSFSEGTDVSQLSSQRGVILLGEPERVTDFSMYRHISWLAKKYALTVLPSVSTLQALRRFAKDSQATSPFIGFGDPLLAGHPGSGVEMQVATLFQRGPVTDAEWVLLSACNTAAADGTPGAEGLSGLAKAFFYAGTRALLVSHWSVFSDATVQLTTRMFAHLAANPKMGRAEALRQAMLSLMTDPQHPRYAHPLFWAPFIVVGEGGTFQVQ